MPYDLIIVVGGKASCLHASSGSQYPGSMELTPEDIAEFIAIWHEEFGETITEAEARHHGSQLLELYLALAAIDPRDVASTP